MNKDWHNYIFWRESIQSFICDCYWVGGRIQVIYIWATYYRTWINGIFRGIPLLNRHLRWPTGRYNLHRYLLEDLRGQPCSLGKWWENPWDQGPPIINPKYTLYYVGIYWFPNPLLKGSNQGGVKQLATTVPLPSNEKSITLPKTWALFRHVWGVRMGSWS